MLSFSHWRSRLASLAVIGQTQVRFLVVTVLSVQTIEFASRYDRDENSCDLRCNVLSVLT